MIERLSLRNFKSHEDSIIEFHQGLNIFLGEVGAGKTSIFEAISFALFGKYAGSINQSGLIRRGAESAEISLTFATSSGRYRVDRRIFPKKTQEAKMWVFSGEEWKLAVEGAVAVSKSVEEILNVDTSTFLAATYASQGEIKEMLETQPGKRRERFDKLLGIDMYENIWKTLGDARSSVLTELTEAQDKANGVEVLEKQLRDLKVQIKGRKKKRSELEGSFREICEKLKPTEHRLRELDELKQQLLMIQTQIKGKSNEIENTIDVSAALRERRERADEASQIFERNKEYIELERKLEDEKRRVETALQQKQSIELILRRDESELQQTLERQEKLTTQLETLDTLKKELKILEAGKAATPTLKDDQAILNKELDELKAELLTATHEIENHKKKVERVTELGECPTCLQTVPDQHKARIQDETRKIITKLETQYSNLDEARGEIQKKLEEVRQKLEKAEQTEWQYVETVTKVDLLTSRLEERQEVAATITELKNSVAENQEQIDAIKETPESLKTLDAELEDIGLKADRAREAEQLSAAKKDIEAMFLQEERNLIVLKDQLNRLNMSEQELSKKYDIKEHEETENNAKALREDRAKTLEGIAWLQKANEEDALKVKSITEVLGEKRDAMEMVERLRDESRIIDALRQSLRDVVQPIMRKNNVLQVSNSFQTFYQELSNDSIDYAAIDEEGNIDITRNGEPSPVNSLSGGETTCAALALRLAICSGLTKNQLLLLDEPTIHLDEVYRAKLRDFLGNHRLEQLVVVTHDNTFDSLPAKIFRVEKRRGRSVVSPLQGGGA